MRDYLDAELAKMRPTGTWKPVGQSAGIPIWRRQGDEWANTDPPEDLALPPMIEWTNALRNFALAVYCLDWEGALEPNQYYDISWPPDADLRTEGDWCWKPGDECSEHYTEYDSSCEECGDLDHGSMLIDRLAEWSWTVQLHTLERTKLADGTADVQEAETETWTIGTMSMDPGDIEYGPHRDDPRRQLLYMQRDQLSKHEEATG